MLVAALFWCCVLLVELTVSLAITAVIAAMVQWSLAQCLLAVVAILALLKCSLISISFLLAMVNAGLAGRLPHPGFALRALLTEWPRFTLAELRMCVEPLWPPRGRAPQHLSPAPARPVLLIHGIACNRAVWAPMIARLRGAGFGPIETVNLEPMFTDIDAHCGTIERALRELQARSGRRPCIVAHSMGGLVTLAALRSLGSSLVDRVVTIATPYHGTAMANCFHRPAFRQMRLGSDWLRALRTGSPAPEIALTCIYSLEDNLVVPASSAALPAARCIGLRGIGHVGLLQSRQVADQVLAALQGA